MNRTATLLISLAFLAGMGSASHADGIPGAPAPFDKDGMRLALVSYLSAGDYFQAYEAGVARQAKAAGIDLRIFQGKQDAAEMREQILQAISLGVNGILIDHGPPEAIKDVVQKALDVGIKVVIKETAIEDPRIPQISQNDHMMAQLVLDQALKDNGASFNAGYIYVAGFVPTDLRNDIWEKVKKENPGIIEKARWGIVNTTIAASVGDQTAAALRANPDIKVVFAPFDEYARGVKLGATEAGFREKIKVYSIDISTSDIQEMREDGSPWMASAAVDAGVIGEVSLRALALLVAGQDPGHVIEMKPVLITRDYLAKNDIKTLEDLKAKMPELATSDVATAAWLRAPAK
jgi:simple sugar transport system substrate-binding protein